MAEEKQAKLKVAEAYQDDVDKGIVRVDRDILKQIGARPGSLLEIEGQRKTVAIVDSALPSDVGLGVIRLDGMTRRNAGTSIGEFIRITVAEVKEAKKITLAPARRGVMIQAPPQTFLNSLLGRPVSKGDIVSLGGTRTRRRTFSGSPFEDIFNMLGEDFMGGGFGFAGLKFVVVSTDPKEPCIITENTEITLRPEAVEVKEEKIPDVTYEDIGGLGSEIEKVREMIELPLKHPEIFDRLGVQAPKGVLLHGPPGTGKTLIAKAVANESGANFISINGPELMSKFYGESEKNLRSLFEEAEKNSPSIIFIDEIDAIAPKREESYGEVERRIVAQLLALMDGLKSRGRVIVIAATNRPNALDPALRRGGRFDREIEIGVPGKEGRLEVLKIHTRNMPLTKDVDLKELAGMTHGFVGADLEALVKEAAMSVLRRVLPEMSLRNEERVSDELLKKLIVTKNDFKEALKIVTPSAMREVLIETPKTRWSDVGGLLSAKQALKEAIELPLKHPDTFKRLGIRPPRGILLYGPPGTGKTLLVRAVAGETESNFISVKGPELLSKYVGESEKAVREMFRKARQVAPCIIFFDEIDSLAPARGSGDSNRVHELVVSQILTEMDGLEELHDVVIVAASNRPELIDSALLRPGRFDRHILVGAPDEQAREEILKIHTKNMPLGKGVTVTKLAKQMEGYSGADIEAVCREAAMLALRDDLKAKEVTNAYFTEAMKIVRPTVTKDVLKSYMDLLKSQKSRAVAASPDYMG